MILLDTHCLVWFDRNPSGLGRKAQRLAAAAAERYELAAASISFFELAILQQRRRLKMGKALGDWRLELLERGVCEFAIDGVIALRASELAGMSADPFDQLIVAVADIHGLELLTADSRILAWSGALRRHDARE